MSTEAPAASNPKWMSWTGLGISAFAGLGLIASAVGKFMPVTPEMAEQLGRIGWKPERMQALGVLEIICGVVYLIPQTSVLGAILITGYMGGAIATHVRIDDYFIVQIIVGVLPWLGLYLRDARIRALIPLRS
jgi:hypothetical protein